MHFTRLKIKSSWLYMNVNKWLMTSLWALCLCLYLKVNLAVTILTRWSVCEHFLWHMVTLIFSAFTSVSLLVLFLVHLSLLQLVLNALLLHPNLSCFHSWSLELVLLYESCMWLAPMHTPVILFFFPNVYFVNLKSNKVQSVFFKLVLHIAVFLTIHTLLNYARFFFLISMFLF